MAQALYRTALSLLVALGFTLLLLGCEQQVPSPETGRISITSTPSGARIFLDGSDTGRGTPYVTPYVSAGSHNIRLTLAGHSDWEQRNVPVVAGQITTVHAPLQPTNQPQGRDTTPVLPQIDDKAFTLEEYVSEKLPAASGGNGSLVYSLTPSILGLTFDAGTQALYGTPRQAGTYHMRYRVTDEDGDFDSESFTVTVEEQVLMLPPVTSQTYPQGVPISTWALPKATGGAGELTYSLLATPPGLSVWVGSQQYYFSDSWTVPSDSNDPFLLSGTPAEAGVYNIHYEVRDSHGDTDSVLFTITVTVRRCNARSASPRGKIYWTIPDEGKILRANLSGTDVETIYYSPPVPSTHGGHYIISAPAGIAISGDKIYWVDQGNWIRRANLDGTCVERLVGGGNAPIAIAIANSKMYWTDYNDEHKIKRANLDGTRIEALYSGTELPAEIAVSGGKMYWTAKTRTGMFDTTGVGVRRANLDGTGIELLVTGIANPYGVAVTADKIYWTDRIHWGVLGGGKIQRANLDGSNIETLVSNLRQPLAIVIHSNRMYWIENHGAVKSANLDGTDVQSLVSPDGKGAYGRGLAIR